MPCFAAYQLVLVPHNPRRSLAIARQSMAGARRGLWGMESIMKCWLHSRRVQTHYVVPLTINQKITVLHLSNTGRVLVDTSDMPMIAKWKWHLGSGGYAQRSTKIGGRKGRCVTVLLHVFLMKPHPDIQVDHKNLNRFDCRRSNLRFATKSQNMANRNGWGSHSKGVGFDKRSVSKPWRAFVQRDGKRIYLGTFATESEAAQAYSVAAKAQYGEFAKLS